MACPFGAPRYDASAGVMTKCDFCRHESTGRADRLPATEQAAVGRPFPPPPAVSPSGLRRGLAEALRAKAGRVAPDTVHTPACIAACPTEALGLAAAADDGREWLDDAPGFADPAACGPNIRFVRPRGARRSALLNALSERLGRR
jgi:Fe-S-cluster-containing dehydrogenase component